MEDKRKTVPFKKEELALPRPPERKTTHIYSDSEEEENSEEDEASDDEDDGPTKITEQQRKLVAGVLTKEINVPDPKDPESDITKAFKTTHKSTIEGWGRRGETILHHIGDESKKSSKLIQLGSWLLETYPSLILKQDVEGCTALYNAFRHDNRSFVRQVLDRPEAAETLRKSCTDGSTCFHAAFGMNYTGSDDILSKLIEGAEALGEAAKESSKKKVQRILGKKDGSQNTSLHVLAISISTGKPAKMDKKWGKRQKYLMDSASYLMKEYPDSIYQRNRKDQLPYHCCKKPSPVTDPENMDYMKLAEEIKLDLMRNLQSGKITHETVVEALYQDTDELRINFDLSWTSHKTISTIEQERWVNHLRFENILQYVHLPNIDLEDGGEPLMSDISENEQITGISALKGSVDALKILDWLRRRGMGESFNRRILEVTVEDDESSPHSDEAIELALKDLQVEKLDWRRPDLCSDVIPQTVTEVYLYSSGNNAVLRGWSSDNGLARLKNLKTVHLSIVQGLETQDRMRKYAFQFEEDLRKKIPGIQFHPPEFPRLHRPPTFSKTQKDANPVPRNPWLECMAKFAYFVQNNKPTGDIKVAVIDDGIDLSHPIFKKRIVDGKSYLKRSTKLRSDRTMDYFVAPGGHGTDMASLICQICPTAKLYIVRLNEGQGGAGERQIMADSAAKAVEWARRQKVDIISMSWSIKSPDLAAEAPANEKDVKAIANFQRSIRDAYNDGITMFCAASDLGKSRDAASSSVSRVPAAWGDTITIGAADSDGSPSHLVGTQTVDFYLPGMDIVVDGHVPAKGQPKSGSSLATAVASGLAALILYCIKTADGGGDGAADSVLKPDGMKMAITRLCVTNQRVPEVVKTFGNIDNDSLDTPQKAREKFQAIAAELRGKR